MVSFHLPQRMASSGVQEMFSSTIPLGVDGPQNMGYELISKVAEH